MNEVTIRELRNQGAAVLDRVWPGHSLTVTRDGRPVAELRPLQRAPLLAEALLREWRHLPPVNGARLEADIDAAMDPLL